MQRERHLRDPVGRVEIHRSVQQASPDQGMSDLLHGGGLGGPLLVH